MIRSKDFNKEINVLNDKVKKTPEKVGLADLVKAVLLVGKMVRDVRTNQVIAMKAQNIDLIESEKANDNAKEQTKEE